MGIIESLTGKPNRVQFIQKNQDDGSSSIFSIDCTIKQTHSRKSTPTKFQIENGNSISDHIILDPFHLELEGIISDSPISINAALQATAAGAVGNAIGGALGASAAIGGIAIFNALQKSKSRSVQAYIQLLKIQENRLPFDVITGYKKYENMWVASVSAPRDDKTGNAFHFTVLLEQLLIVYPQTVILRALKKGDVGYVETEKGEESAAQSKLAAKVKEGHASEQSIAKGFGA